LAKKVSKRPQKEAVQLFLLRGIRASDPDLVATAALEFGISRQAVNAHLRRMVSNGVLKPVGETRARKYLIKRESHTRRFPISAELKEHEVWESFVRPLVADLPDNVRNICQYGFTEMLNNAIEHSGGTTVTVGVERSKVDVELNVLDNGIGIFRKIRESLELEDDQHAVFELSKGKLTTDPERHTGEGIFFSSRAFDQFSILSGGLYLTHSTVPDRDWLLEMGSSSKGTMVSMEIAAESDRVLKAVFDKFATVERPYSFAVTHVPVALATVGADNLVSRSQARRFVARLHLFDTVMLDFTGVSEIGQAFADEVFRVFANEHPGIRLRWMGANKAVEGMILRAVGEGKADGA
jgi:anti-sigma regulatory factor (Ser/Thr protein kinase)